MCLIVQKPLSASIPIVLLQDAFIKNSDGWGIMYAESGKIFTSKGFSLDDLIDNVAELQAQRQIFVHLRMRTHGNISYENLHPFQVTEDICLMHNGIIDISTSKQESDTSAFVRMIRPMIEVNPHLIFDQGWLNLVSTFIGTSRVVFLHSSGKYSIVGRDKGIQWQGLWCSNTYAWSLWDNKPKLAAFKSYQPTKKSNYSWLDTQDDYFDWHLDATERDIPKIKDVADIQYLRSLDYQDLEDLIWDDPDIAIQAIYAS